MRHPGRLLLATGTAAGRARRTLRAPRYARVPSDPRGWHSTTRRHRTRARREQRGGRRVRVCGLEIDRRYPHLLQRHATPRLHQTGRALASGHGSCKFATRFIAHDDLLFNRGAILTFVKRILFRSRAPERNLISFIYMYFFSVFRFPFPLGFIFHFFNIVYES